MVSRKCTLVCKPTACPLNVAKSEKAKSKVESRKDIWQETTVGEHTNKNNVFFQ